MRRERRPLRGTVETQPAEQGFEARVPAKQIDSRVYAEHHHHPRVFFARGVLQPFDGLVGVDVNKGSARW
jgi:hypothetical protein